MDLPDHCEWKCQWWVLFIYFLQLHGVGLPGLYLARDVGNERADAGADTERPGDCLKVWEYGSEEFRISFKNNFSFSFKSIYSFLIIISILPYSHTPILSSAFFVDSLAQAFGFKL